MAALAKATFSNLVLRTVMLASLLVAVWLVSPLAATFVASLVFVAGAPHGAAELTASGMKPPGLAYTGRYLLMAAFAAWLWWLSPAFALVGFLVLAAIHFGMDDPCLRSSGAWVVAGPFILHGDATLAIFERLGGISLSALHPAFELAAWVALVALLAEAVTKGRWRYGALLIGLGLALPPVLSVATYYGAIHVASVWSDLPTQLRRSRGMKICGTAFVAGGVATVVMVASGLLPLTWAAALAVSLTAPHVALGIWHADRSVRPKSVLPATAH